AAGVAEGLARLVSEVEVIALLIVLPDPVAAHVAASTEVEPAAFAARERPGSSEDLARGAVEIAPVALLGSLDDAVAADLARAAERARLPVELDRAAGEVRDLGLVLEESACDRRHAARHPDLLAGRTEEGDEAGRQRRGRCRDPRRRERASGQP